MSDAGQPAFAVARAKVAAASLRQQDVRVLDEGCTIVLAVALGPPRLWAYLLDLALDGFEEGYDQLYDERASTRVHQGLRCAQEWLRERAGALVERRLPDAGLLALSLEGLRLHVLSAGPLRAFVHQRGAGLRTLSADADAGAGVLRGPSSWRAEQVAPGDLVFAGSRSACSERSVQQLERELALGASPDAGQVVEMLNGPAAAQGLAAAAAAFRVQG